MAISTQKFLPQAKNSSLVVSKPTAVRSIGSSVSNKKTFVIKEKVIEIDKILKGTLASEKKEIDSKKKQDEKEKRQNAEKTLETSEEKKSKKTKLQIPKVKFFDRIKDFFGNILMGFILTRLIEYAPIIEKFLPIIKNTFNFITDFVIGIIDALGTFLLWGKKAIDGTRNFIGDKFGDDAVKNFDALGDNLFKLLNAMVLIGAASVAMRGPRGPRSRSRTRIRQPVEEAFRQRGKKGPPGTTSRGAAIRYARRYGQRAATRRFGRQAAQSLAARTLAKRFVSPFVKRIPIIGGLIDFALNYFVFKEPVGRAAFAAIGATIFGALGATAGSIIPVAGNFIGGALGGIAGDIAGKWLYDTFFDKKKPVEDLDEEPKDYTRAGTNEGIPSGSATNLAGEAGKYIQSKLSTPKDYQAITEHPDFGGIRGKHSANSWHYKGRALDIGAWTHEQGPILKVIEDFNKMKGVSPVELIHGGTDPAGHGDHIHVAYAKGGETLGYPHLAMLGEEGKEIVIDADSQGPARDMLLAINQAKGYDAVMQAIRDYAPYEALSSQVVIVEKIKEVVKQTPYSEKSSMYPNFSASRSEDPFEFLSSQG